jgi:hypothetical protein
VKLVYAVCALHNFIVEHENDSHFLQKADNERKKREKKLQRRMDRRRRRSLNIAVPEADDTHTAEAGALRDTIATAMWEQYTGVLVARR